MLPILTRILKDLDQLGRRRNKNRQNQNNQQYNKQYNNSKKSRQHIFFTTNPNDVKDIFFPDADPTTPTYFKVADYIEAPHEL